jgi:mitochondrial fission protein ELM1
MTIEGVMERSGPGPAEAPRVWLLLGDKKGDNGQVHTIEEALGWPCELRHIQVLDEFVFGKPRVGPTLYHIDRDRSDPLEPPWPDLIITVGRRPANVALWIKEQSGGRTRIVLVGKPSGMMDSFDLIVASSENRFPPLPNVLPISLPLMRVDEAAVAAGAETWRQRLEALPRPLIGVMVGGPTGPYVFDSSVTDQLIAAARQVVYRGGTPYFTTSRRTPPALVKDLQERLPEDSRLFAWSADAEENPYMGLLGCADGFIVTGDSISMLVEVVRLHKPLAILSLPTSLLGSVDQLRRSLARWLFAPVDDSAGGWLRNLLARLVYQSGFITHTRDFRAFHQMLIDRGLAVEASGEIPPPSGEAPDDAKRVVERIRALMRQQESPGT